MKCNNCGAEFEGNFCPMCGTPAMPPDTELTCKVCGTKFKGKFCPECGMEYGAKPQTETAARPAASEVTQADGLLRIFCRYAAAITAIILGIATLAAFAGPSMTFMGETVLSGYDWLKGGEEGTAYATVILIFGILSFMSGFVHLCFILAENKNKVTIVAFARVRLNTLLSVADTVIMLACAVAAIASALWLDEYSMGMYESGAAILCPLVIGLIFTVAAVAAALLERMKKIVYFSTLGHINASPVKRPQFWSDLPESFKTPQNMRAASLIYHERGLRLVNLAVYMAAVIVTAAIMILQASASYQPAQPSLPPLFSTYAQQTSTYYSSAAQDSSFEMTTMIFAAFIVIVSLICPINYNFAKINENTKMKKIKRTLSMAILIIVINVYLLFILFMSGIQFNSTQKTILMILIVVSVALDALTLCEQAALRSLIKRCMQLSGSQNITGRQAVIGNAWVNIEKCAEYNFYNTAKEKFPQYSTR